MTSGITPTNQKIHTQNDIAPFSAHKNQSQADFSSSSLSASTQPPKNVANSSWDCLSAVWEFFAGCLSDIGSFFQGIFSFFFSAAESPPLPLTPSQLVSAFCEKWKKFDRTVAPTPEAIAEWGNELEALPDTARHKALMKFSEGERKGGPVSLAQEFEFMKRAVANNEVLISLQKWLITQKRIEAFPKVEQFFMKWSNPLKSASLQQMQSVWKTEMAATLALSSEIAEYAIQSYIHDHAKEFPGYMGEWNEQMNAKITATILDSCADNSALLGLREWLAMAKTEKHESKRGH